MVSFASFILSIIVKWYVVFLCICWKKSIVHALYEFKATKLHCTHSALYTMVRKPAKMSILDLKMNMDLCGKTDTKFKLKIKYL